MIPDHRSLCIAGRTPWSCKQSSSTWTASSPTPPNTIIAPGSAWPTRKGCTSTGQINERLRGVARRASLEIILAGRRGHRGPDRRDDRAQERLLRGDARTRSRRPTCCPARWRCSRNCARPASRSASGSVSKNAPAVLDTPGHRRAAGRGGRRPQRGAQQARARSLPEGGRACWACRRPSARWWRTPRWASMRRWRPACGPSAWGRPSGWAMPTCVSTAWTGVTLAASAAGLENAAWTVAEAAFRPGPP